jgi:hypothetical protein
MEKQHAMEMSELENSRNMYDREIERILKQGANPQFGITPAQVENLVKKLREMRDGCDELISFYRGLQNSYRT